MNEELVQAIVGIGFAVLGIGSVLEFRRRRMAHERRQAFEGESITHPRNDGTRSAQELTYFIIKQPVNVPLLYRVYVDEKALLFLDVATAHLGLFNAGFLTGNKMPVWLTPAGTIPSALVYGYIAVGSVAMWFAVNELVAGWINPGAFRIGGALVAAAIVAAIVFAIFLLLLVPVLLGRAKRRMAELDELEVAQLREQAAIREHCLTATADSITDIRIRLLHRVEDGPTATLQFRHVTAGRRRYETTNREETRRTIQEFLRLWGPAVQIDRELYRSYVDPDGVGE